MANLPSEIGRTANNCINKKFFKPHLGALMALYGAKTLWSTCICPKLSPKAKNSQILMINCTPFQATVLANKFYAQFSRVSKKIFWNP